MRVSIAKRAGALGAIATCLGQAGVDINRLQTHSKDEGGAVMLDLLLDLPLCQSLDEVVARCRALDGVQVEQVDSYPAGADLHQDLEVVQRLTHCERADRSLVLAAAAPLLCGGSWAVLFDNGDLSVRFATQLAPPLRPEQLSRLGPLGQTRALPPEEASADALAPSGGLAVVALPPGETLLIGRTEGLGFTAAELARLDHLAGIASASRRPS
jgi:hypothetical protein